MHSNIPGHSQNSGVCEYDEIGKYSIKLDKANIEMKKDVETIIDNDPSSIIIIAGDHGPSLTKNCFKLEKGGYQISEISRLDIQDRFGTFLAIRWPDDEYEQFDEIVVIQDLFPAIFAYLYQDENFLDARIESSTLSSLAIVENGIIYGGINEGEPLFIAGE